MASFIYLGGLFGRKEKMSPFRWQKELDTWRGRGQKACIAKGNIIEGIEAKE